MERADTTSTGHKSGEQASDSDIYLRNLESTKLMPAEVAECNPALLCRRDATLDIEPYPTEILKRINVGEVCHATEKNGELIVPVIALYRCVWDGAPIYLQEKSEVWGGAVFGTTDWLNSKQLGTYSIPIDASLLRNLQCQNDTSSNIDAVTALTGAQYPQAKSRTIGRYIASLITAGDNHITLLTAAYCALFDRLWWYFPDSQ